MISVLMGVYNGEKTVEAAVRSILEGDYQDLELILINDGSTDGTSEVLERIAEEDARIVLLHSEQNHGLAHALNKGLAAARGAYIARQDADDISHPNRLSRLLNYLLENPELSFVGSAVRLVEDGTVWGERRFPVRPDVQTVLSYNPFVHPSMLFYKSVMAAVGGYRALPYTVRCEDYDLVFRLYAAGYQGGNLPEVLMDYHEQRDSANRHTLRTRTNEYRVRREGSKRLHGGLRGFFYSLKPLALLLARGKVYNALHNRKWQKR